MSQPAFALLASSCLAFSTPCRLTLLLVSVHSPLKTSQICGGGAVVPSYYGVSLIKTSPWIHDTLSFSTDAWGSGAGGYFNGQFSHTPFPHPIMLLYGHDINILELLTIMVALRLWGTALRGQRVIISFDNENNVFALNSGRSRTPPPLISRSAPITYQVSPMPSPITFLKATGIFSQSQGSFRGFDIWQLNHFRPMPSRVV